LIALDRAPRLHWHACLSLTPRQPYSAGCRYKYQVTAVPFEHSQVATRDRLQRTRGLKRVATGQHFLECFEGLQAFCRGDVKLHVFVPEYQPTKASVHETTRAVMMAMNVLEAQLRKAA